MTHRHLLGTLVLLSVLLLPPAWALADDVDVRTADGHVIAGTTVDATLADVRALLGSPARIAEVEGRGARVTSRPDEGCIRSDIIASTGVGDVAYTTRMCPVADGYEGSLVSSEKIRDMQARWTLTEQGDRVHIEYDLFFVPRVKVPQRLVAALAKRGVKRLIEGIRDELELDGQAAASPY